MEIKKVKTSKEDWDIIYKLLPGAGLTDWDGVDHEHRVIIAKLLRDYEKRGGKPFKILCD